MFANVSPRAIWCRILPRLPVIIHLVALALVVPHTVITRLIFHGMFIIHFVERPRESSFPDSTPANVSSSTRSSRIRFRNCFTAETNTSPRIQTIVVNMQPTTRARIKKRLYNRSAGFRKVNREHRHPLTTSTQKRTCEIPRLLSTQCTSPPHEFEYHSINTDRYNCGNTMAKLRRNHILASVVCLKRPCCSSCCTIWPAHTKFSIDR